jgi:hypothetical protein
MRVMIDAGGDVPPSPFAEISIDERRLGETTVLEIATTAAHLFPEFHRLSSLFAEELENRDQTIIKSFLKVAERWRELTARRQVLSPEAQLGLLGEVAFLQALVSRLGPAAVVSWTARVADLPERHDFRLDDVDIEVKTTRGAERKHVIHGLTQLSPSAGHSLFLVSLKFEAAGFGGGVSLVERVECLRKAIAKEKNAKAVFEDRLLKANYRDDDAAYYRERLLLADAPMLIPVNDACPRIVAPLLEVALGYDCAARIGRDVSYGVNVEGLGRRLADAPSDLPCGPLSVE